MDELNRITEKIIGCAIEVHRNLGPGLLESVYEKAMAIEFKEYGLNFEKQKELNITYKDHPIGRFKMDFPVENKIVVELKSVERHDPVFEAQLLSYLKLGKYKLGLLKNFNKQLLKEGIKRIIL